jgi:ubiquinone/menaquinone biosynthesis C-methylase UbiE
MIRTFLCKEMYRNHHKINEKYITMRSLDENTETADIETSSEDYAQRFSGKIGEWFLKVQEEATLRMINLYPSASILDVGGGHGQLTEALIRNECKITVLGSSQICKNRIRELVDQGRCEFTTGNILDLPYPDNAYDVVMSYRLLPHVTRWSKLIAELTRVARRAVIVDYPTIRSINCISPFLFDFKKRLEKNTRPYTLFRESELIEVFRSHRFVVSERYPEFFLPMALHRILKSPAFSSLAENVFHGIGLTSLFGSPVILKLTREDQVTH